MHAARRHVLEAFVGDEHLRRYAQLIDWLVVTEVIRPRRWPGHLFGNGPSALGERTTTPHGGGRKFER